MLGREISYWYWEGDGGLCETPKVATEVLGCIGVESVKPKSVDVERMEMEKWIISSEMKTRSGEWVEMRWPWALIAGELAMPLQFQWRIFNMGMKGGWEPFFLLTLLVIGPTEEEVFRFLPFFFNPGRGMGRGRSQLLSHWLLLMEKTGWNRSMWTRLRDLRGAGLKHRWRRGGNSLEAREGGAEWGKCWLRSTAKEVVQWRCNFLGLRKG